MVTPIVGKLKTKVERMSRGQIHRMPQPPARKACGVTSLGVDFVHACVFIKYCTGNFAKALSTGNLKDFPFKAVYVI